MGINRGKYVNILSGFGMGVGLRSSPGAISKPLPVFPLPAGSKLVMFGDSMNARAHINTASGGLYSYLRQEMNWVWGLDPRYDIDTWYDPKAPFKVAGELFNGGNQGLGGDRFTYVSPTRPGFLTRMNYAAARGAQVVYFIGGWNDINDGRVLAEIIKDLETMLGFFRRQGIFVVICTLPPSLAWPALDPRIQVLVGYNAYIAGLVGREGIAVADTRSVLGDGADAVVGVLATDNTHKSDKGARLTAGVLSPILETMFSPGSVFEKNPIVAGNYLPQAGLLGTTGTKTNVSGNMATGWVVTQPAAQSSVVVASKEVVSGDVEKQVFAVTPAADAVTTPLITISRPALTLATAGLVPGDWIQIGWLIEFDNWPGWRLARVAWDMRSGGTALTSGYAMNMGNGGEPNISGIPTTLWMATPPLRIPETVTELRLSSTSGSLTFLNFYWAQGAAGTGVVKASMPFIRKVADPRPNWNLE